MRRMEGPNYDRIDRPQLGREPNLRIKCVLKRTGAPTRDVDFVLNSELCLAELKQTLSYYLKASRPSLSLTGKSGTVLDSRFDRILIRAVGIYCESAIVGTTYTVELKKTAIPRGKLPSQVIANSDKLLNAFIFYMSVNEGMFRPTIRG